MQIVHQFSDQLTYGSIAVIVGMTYAFLRWGLYLVTCLFIVVFNKGDTAGLQDLAVAAKAYHRPWFVIRRRPPMDDDASGAGP